MLTLSRKSVQPDKAQLCTEYDVYSSLRVILLALVDADFNTTPIIITIPAGTKLKEFEIPNTFFFDDEINEMDQSFALVGVLGDDVPESFACFQRRTGDPLCFGKTGATTIKIEDNDGKVLK